MDKRTRKNQVTEKKAKKSRVQELIDDFKTSLNPELILEKCNQLIIQINEEKAKDKSNSLVNLLEQYEAILNVIDESGLNEHLTSEKSSFKYYPDYNNRNFNDLIYKKKEFYLHRGEEVNITDKTELENTSKKLCDPLFDSITGTRVSDKSKIMFNLTNSQKFLKTFMSPHTPYNSLLIYHGTGVGKTCTSISIAEQYIEDLQREGKKVIIILNQSIKENFIKNIFNVQKVKSDMPYYQCTGESYLKHIPNYQNMSLEDIQKKIYKLVKNRYEFFGYQKFANVISGIEAKIYERFSEDVAPKIFEKKIKEMFSNNVLIIDEAHNIKEGESMKVLPPILEKVIRIADNMKLLLLTATPMFDNATEIIWLVNLLLMNQKKPTLKMDDFFEQGKIIADKIPEFKKKMRGLVSYVRGENPLRFPKARYPEGKGIITPDKAPKKTIDHEDIDLEDQLKELVLVDCPMTGLQSDIYNKMIESPDQFGAFKQPGIMCSNIVFPHNKLNGSPSNSNSSSSNSNTPQSPSRFNLREFIGDDGFANVAEKKKDGERTIFEINQKKNIFLSDNLAEFSSKISRLVDNIKKSEGVVFIYSQFINSGVIPIALALEHAGYSKYGGSLLKKEKRPNLGKYIIISGSNDISKNAYKNYLKIENENKEGKRVKIIIGSETASEGLDFRFIRSVHILEPWFHLNKIDQVVVLSIRNCSHIDLPSEKRNVTIYYYCSTNEKMRDRESLDISIYREAEKKSRNMAEVEYAIKTSAVDCEINKHNNKFFTDRDYSRRCNYKKCDFKCDGISKSDLLDNDLNFDTINKDILKDATNDVIKILKYGNNKNTRLFSDDSIFSLDQILNYVDMDLLVTLLGLHRLILSRDIITDQYGRNCILKYKNGMYVLVPQKLESTLYTENDLRVVPYKKTQKLEIKGDKIKELLSGKLSVELSKAGDISKIKHKRMITKTARNTKGTTLGKQTKKNNKAGNVATNDLNRNNNTGLKLVASYDKIYNQIIKTVVENSSNYLKNIISNNKSKDQEIHDEVELIRLFDEINYHWLDFLDPNDKKIICEVLIIKNHHTKLNKVETEIFKSLYNIMSYGDVYYKDIVFKGNKKTIWGYKLGNFKKKIDYIHFNEETETFEKALTEESQAIQKSFLKRQKEKTESGLPKNSEFYQPNNLIGFIELKLPQNQMVFKIRDKSTEKPDKGGKLKGTQVKTGSICNNDGMKKQKVIKFIANLLDLTEDLPYEGVEKRRLPDKDLLCLQLETYFRYFDKDKHNNKRFFYNYEESLEFELTKKK